MAEEKIWLVSEVNSVLKDMIEGTFYPFWLEGEVGTINIHRSGHVYLTLKDGSSQIKAAYFGGAEIARELGLAQGVMIEAFGRLSVYVPRGEYQFTLSRLRLKGVGGLYKKFEETREKLKKEGLFDEARKKKIPILPLRIGVVTSPEGAAIRDFLNIINRRFPNLHIRIYPCAVQGRGAEFQVAEGIRFFNRTGFPDVIIITRGGGSIEDLWPFNEEVLAREIAGSRIPVISAVGHEIDYTIADFVADLRVPTPSAAAELVIAKEGDFVTMIGDMKRRFALALQTRLERARHSLERLAQSHVFKEPLFVLREKQQRVDELFARLEKYAAAIFAGKKSSLDIFSATLSALSPYNVLNRGYSILKKSDDSIVSCADEVSEEEELLAILARGKLSLRISGKIL
jgi:exodeoxyribonuclease VII large subunit